MSIRAAVVGTSHAARHHIAAARLGSGLEISAVAGRSAAAARDITAECGPGMGAIGIDEALRSPDFDAIVVAVAPSAQADIAVSAFENGKHVLCEKPLAPTAAEARRISDAWRASGRVGMVNLCYRLIPEIRAFGEAIAAGACGKLNLIHVEWMLSTRLDRRDPPSWKGDLRQGGGVLQNYGCMVIDYLFHDTPHVEIVGARVSENTASVLFEMPGRASAFLHLSLQTRPAIGHRLLACGTEATLEVYNPDPSSPAGPFHLKWSPPRPESSYAGAEESARDLPQLFRPIQQRFVEAIASGAVEYSPDISVGVHVAEIIDRIGEHTK